MPPQFHLLELSPADALSQRREQFHQIDLINSHEGAGNLTPATANRYRLHVLRGGNIFGFPLDGPNAPRFVERWNETGRALRSDRLRFHAQRPRRSPGRVLAAARAPRRRSVRTHSGSRARAPSGPLDDPAEPPLEVVPSRASGATLVAGWRERL